MHRNNAADSFPQRIRTAYYKVLDTVMERYHVLRKSDWSLLAESQKLFAYTDGQAVDGIPIDWFVSGCLEPRDAPADYRGDRWDVLKKNQLYPIIDTINKKISSEFRTKVVLSGMRSNYTTIYLAVDDLSKVRMSLITGVLDKNIAKWTTRVRARSRSRSPVRRQSREHDRKRNDSPSRGRERKRSRSRSRSPARDHPRDNVIAPPPKRVCAKPSGELNDLMAESARVLAELTAVTKMIAAHRAEIDSADPKIRAEQFLASFNN
jgi:hypothetical protein